MSKRKRRKIDITDLFHTEPDKTLIRPNSISITLENRGKDFKLEYEEKFNQKQSVESWTIENTLNALKKIQEDIDRLNKYFYYQVKSLKKGYQLMIVSDDAFALVAAVLAELLAFGVRDKEDSYNFNNFLEPLLKWISKTNIIDD